MTIDQIKYFLAIVEHKNYSIAADELCISQSSLSKQIKKLEEELNVLLFDRNTRNLKLTEAGEDFNSSAELIANEYSTMLTKMKSHTVEEDKLNLSTIPVLNQYGLTPIIARFINDNKDINLNIEETVYSKIKTSLLNGNTDIAIMRSDTLNSDDYDISPLLQDELAVIVSKNHPLAKKKYINLEDLKDEKFILLSEDSDIYIISISACKSAGFSPDVLYCHSRIETIIGLVGSGVGITLLMGQITKCFNSSNTSTILLNNKIPSTLALVTHKNKKASHNCETFKKFILNSLN